MTTHPPTPRTDQQPQRGGGSVGQAGQRAGEEAGHLAERAGELGVRRANAAREQTADGLEQLASSVRQVSSDLEQDQPMIANATRTAADQTERLAGFLRETDSREMIGAVEDFARRQPLIFVGGALILGLGAARLLKAGADGGGNGGGGSGGKSSGGGRGGRGRMDLPDYGAEADIGSGAPYPAGSGSGYRASAAGGTPEVGFADPTDEGLRP